ncbi:MAG: purine-nucleoside phosphorylase [Desulfovibrio sp.]|jgi:purine-nucleoside phosphorylase|nr:purine-nucleoside phosphorylase [Desulfovibrio sp.]
MQNAEKVQICVQTLKNKLPSSFSPVAGLVLGTGLGGLAGAFEGKISVPYADLPGFPPSGVVSHAGCFAAGYFAGVPVLAQQGRCHLYEGRTPEEVCMGVRVMAGLGIKALIVTNAAGALNSRFNAGGLMLVADHINLTGRSPLTGLAEKEGIFIDMGKAYDAALARLAEEAALRLALRLEKGVYVGVAGPQLETGAETRFYRLIGGDAIGMSSVLEVIAARHLGLRVLALSCLTNKNLPDCMEEADIEAIVRVAGQCGASLERLLRALLPELAAECVRS